jgi:hypothetical protein
MMAAAQKGARLAQLYGVGGSRRNEEVVQRLAYAPTDESPKGAVALLKFLENFDSEQQH